VEWVIKLFQPQRYYTVQRNTCEHSPHCVQARLLLWLITVLYHHSYQWLKAIKNCKRNQASFNTEM